MRGIAQPRLRSEQKAHNRAHTSRTTNCLLLTSIITMIEKKNEWRLNERRMSTDVPKTKRENHQVVNLLTH